MECCAQAFVLTDQLAVMVNGDGDDFGDAISTLYL